MNELTLCGGCERHVRADETACPFCDAALEAPPAPAAPGPIRARAGRAAVVALGVSLAMGTSSCVALYGAPAPDDAGVAEDGEIPEE